MFETVSQGFRSARNFLNAKAELNAENIDQALREVRVSLLEADVEFNVVRNFLDRVKEKSLGKVVSTSTNDKKGRKLKLSPAEHFVGICHEELLALMGPVDTSIRLSNPIGTIMMVGLQGSGKTTTAGKIARMLQKKQHRPMLVAADIYRPAAVEQLKVLGESLGVPVFADPTLSPPELCKAALSKAKEWQKNVVIFDTAGRLAIDDVLMNELEQIKALAKPDNIFLVVDAMIGQDAVKTAAAFNKRLSIDGFILTKLDGDARGGAALSIKEVTGKPIKFLGMGEHLNELEEFRPDGLASRILGMGDIVGLAKDFEEHVDQEKAEKSAERMLKGAFGLDDFVDQIRTIRKMGPLKGLLEKLPGMGDLFSQGASVDEREFVKVESIIQSMTPKERKKPEIVVSQKSRRSRIARGSGRKENDIDQLLQRFQMMRQMMQLMGTQPSLLGKLPMFKQFGQMAQMAKQFPQMQQMASQMKDFANPFMQSPGRSMQLQPRANEKDKKDKRKREKAARKKNKKRK